MSPLRSYQRLFGLVGPLYVVVAFVARIPLAMAQIGTLLLVADATGSYGAGGAAAGALAIANAIASPFTGTLADRFGQRRVVGIQSALGAAGLVGVVLTSTSDASTLLVLATAALAGASLPQVGPLARVRWRPITAHETHQRRLVSTAFSYEGAADEASFVLGPTLVGVVAALVSPAGALLTAAGMLAVFGSWFALHRTAPAGFRRTRSATDAPLLSAALLVLLLAQGCLGMIFGSIQTGSTVLATSAGMPGAAGLVHALLGIGSVLAGLATVYLPDSFSLPARLAVAAAGLSVLATPLLIVDSLTGASVVTLLLGFAVAPFMITAFTLAERVVPRDRVTTAMTLLAGATGLGYAAGSALAGHLADAAQAGDLGGLTAGHTAAYVVTVSGAAAALLLALLAGGVLRRADRASRETPDGPSEEGATEVGAQKSAQPRGSDTPAPAAAR
ncbi:MFS transporter [Nocardioides alkalitolerans]|uniref:MFS transporter n=1 Tax=Nocardioides alkalitolerans TaxID=281714 RepID=UPI0003F56B19|nr:MFS transporter [Nocardioides alkalitolerans]